MLKTGERLVAHLEHEPRLVAERRRCPGWAGPCASLRDLAAACFSSSGSVRDQRDADAAGRRHGELLRLERLGVRRLLTPSPGRPTGSPLNSARPVSFVLAVRGVPATTSVTLCPAMRIGHDAAGDPNDDRADREIADRQRHA